MKITSKISSKLKIGQKIAEFADKAVTKTDELVDSLDSPKKGRGKKSVSESHSFLKTGKKIIKYVNGMMTDAVELAKDLKPEDEEQENESVNESRSFNESQGSDDTSCQNDSNSSDGDGTPEEKDDASFNDDKASTENSDASFEGSTASCEKNCDSSDSDDLEDENVINGVLDDEPGSFEHSSQKLSAAISEAAGSGFQDPAAVGKALGALVEVASDTIKYVAEQTTIQEEIRKERDIAIAQINATTELIKQYLEKTFDERKMIFNKQFEAVDEALRTGNTQMLAVSLQSINALAAQSPFKALSDINQVKQALSDDDTVWDI